MEAFISTSDAILRYTRYGRGERIVVLLHGYGQSIEVWEAFGGQLGKDFSVIAIDLPGSGISTYGDRATISIEYMASSVVEALTKLGVDKYSIIAHSMGGYVAAALCELDSVRVERVLMFHSSPLGDSVDRRDIREREISIIESDKKEMLAQANPSKGFAAQNVKKCAEAIDEKIEQFMLTDDAALVAMLRGMGEREDRSASFALFAATHPVLFIFGAFDPYMPIEVQTLMRERFASARFELLDNSAHMGFIEEPAKSLEIALDFLK